MVLPPYSQQSSALKDHTTQRCRVVCLEPFGFNRFKVIRPLCIALLWCVCVQCVRVYTHTVLVAEDDEKASKAQHVADGETWRRDDEPFVRSRTTLHVRFLAILSEGDRHRGERCEQDPLPCCDRICSDYYCNHGACKSTYRVPRLPRLCVLRCTPCWLGRSM